MWAVFMSRYILFYSVKYKQSNDVIININKTPANT